MAVRLGIVAALWFLANGVLQAQNATVVGTVVDPSKAVLPGVTVTATDISTGRQFVAVTTERGEYRLAGVLPGRYTIAAELAGFRSFTVSDVELLVGQNATVNVVLTLATVSENVTVTGAAPLIDTQRAQIAGNVDRRQMEELPLQGRNWLELSMMVKGVTANSVGQQPGVIRDAAFQLNLDGQQITQNLCCSAGFGQPGLSREAIAEYQIVTNLFDVTMGRSVGLQVQAISRSGTNQVTGSLYGYFRDDALNSKDFVAKRVLPYSNQQVGGTVGGPAIKDKLLYFVSYEGERAPNTNVLAPPAIAPQTISLPTRVNSRNLLARVDHELSANNRVTVRGTYFRTLTENSLGSGTAYPSAALDRLRDSKMVTGTWSRIISNHALQEIRASFFNYSWTDSPSGALTPEYGFPGLTIGAPWNQPQIFTENTPALSYNLTLNRGGHDLKLGGEFLRAVDSGYWPAQSRGRVFFSQSPGDLARRFPIDSWNDPSRWDLSGLDPLVLRVDLYAAPNDDWNLRIPRSTYAAWLSDTWAVSPRLTLNLGVRYDLPWSDLATPGIANSEIVIDNGQFVENVGIRNDLRVLDMVSPRAGFTWKTTDRGDLILRGGTGLFYGSTSGNLAINQQFNSKIYSHSFVNDMLPGFLQDPARGVTTSQIVAGEVPLPPQSPAPIAHDIRMPRTWQSIVGFQKQLGSVMAVDSDLVYWRGVNEDSQRDANLFFDPVTGFNRNPTRFGRPDPRYGPILVRGSRGRSDYAALASSFTRRYQNDFQAGVTYTLMFFKHDTCVGNSGYGCTPNNPFDLGADWARSTDFQRHTIRANSIYRIPWWDLSLAGSFFLGSGNYFSTVSGVNPFGSGGTRIRSDLTVIPRNNFKGRALQRLDLRLTKDLRLGERVKVSAIAEVFNVYNHANYGSYGLLETSTAYGQPVQNLANAYLPRTWQLAFRVGF